MLYFSARKNTSKILQKFCIKYFINCFLLLKTSKEFSRFLVNGNFCNEGYDVLILTTLVELNNDCINESFNIFLQYISSAQNTTQSFVLFCQTICKLSWSQKFLELTSRGLSLISGRLSSIQFFFFFFETRFKFWIQLREPTSASSRAWIVSRNEKSWETENYFPKVSS
jgi:hypothetical protein